MADDWSREEVEAIVADYFVMLGDELAHRPYNKSAHNAALRLHLRGRSKAAVEFKHQNISAVLIEAGFPYVEGYKPARNYQSLLAEVVLARLGVDHSLAIAMEAILSVPVEAPKLVLSWESVVVPPPARERRRAVAEGRTAATRPTKINYLEAEARSRALGISGELFALDAEHHRLWTAGRHDLANRIEHVSATRGDGLGYDIASFETSGRDRLIEVKTTRFGASTPFFASANEVRASDDAADAYHVYRVHRFGKDPRLFVLSGALRVTTTLDPVEFRATPN